MAMYVFCAERDPQMADKIQRWREAVHQKGKGPLQVLWGSGLMSDPLKVLSQVQPDDKVYILGHGDPGPHDGHPIRMVWLQYEGSRRKYSPTQLASILEAHGLPKYVRDVRVYACNSAGAGNLQLQQEEPSAHPPFAMRLREKLNERGYGDVTVSGYRGLLGVGLHDVRELDWIHGAARVSDRHGNHKKSWVTVPGDGLVRVRASTTKVKFESPQPQRRPIAHLAVEIGPVPSIDRERFYALPGEIVTAIGDYNRAGNQLTRGLADLLGGAEARINSSGGHEEPLRTVLNRYADAFLELKKLEALCGNSPAMPRGAIDTRAVSRELTRAVSAAKQKLTRDLQAVQRIGARNAPARHSTTVVGNQGRTRHFRT